MVMRKPTSTIKASAALLGEACGLSVESFRKAFLDVLKPRISNRTQLYIMNLLLNHPASMRRGPSERTRLSRSQNRRSSITLGHARGPYIVRLKPWAPSMGPKPWAPYVPTLYPG